MKNWDRGGSNQAGGDSSCGCPWVNIQKDATSDDLDSVLSGPVMFQLYK